MTLGKKRWLSVLCMMLLLTACLLPAMGQSAAAEETQHYLTWDEYKSARAIDSWDYNVQAEAIADTANYAVELYTAGDRETAYEYAKATYWGYYETSGFERNTMNYISGSRVSEVELAFTNFRKSIKKDNGPEAVAEAADKLIGFLREDGRILSPEGAGASSGETAGAEEDGGSGSGYMLLEKVGIAGLADVRPDELSGGERRRLAIARALIMQPGVLLADEPTADLDDENTRMVLRLLRQCADDGLGVLLVTHEAEAAAYADQVLHMDAGLVLSNAKKNNELGLTTKR